MAPLRSPTPRLAALSPRTARRTCTMSPRIRDSISAFLKHVIACEHDFFVSTLRSLRPARSASRISSIALASKSGGAAPAPTAPGPGPLFHCSSASNESRVAEVDAASSVPAGVPAAPGPGA